MQHLQKTGGYPLCSSFPTFVSSSFAAVPVGAGLPRFLSSPPRILWALRAPRLCVIFFCLPVLPLSTFNRRSRPVGVTAIPAIASAIIIFSEEHPAMTDARSAFATVEEAVEEISQGRMIVLVDDE